MKNTFICEVAYFAGLACDDSNMSTWSSHACSTTCVSYELETRGCEVIFTMVCIYHCKISPTSFHPCNISIFIAHFLHKLSSHSIVAKTKIMTGIFTQLPIGDKFRSYRFMSIQNITHLSWIKQHKIFIVYSSPTDWKCCQNYTSKMYWHFPEYCPPDYQCQIVRGKVIPDFAGHVQIVRAHKIFKLHAQRAHAVKGLMSSLDQMFIILCVYCKGVNYSFIIIGDLK